MGATGSGKTTFINLASGSQFPVGHGLESCTEVVSAAAPFMFEDRRVVLIDTPGFDDTTKSDSEVLRLIATFLSTTYNEGKKLSGVIYLHRISDFRMGGVSKRNFKMFRDLCGETTLKNVVIVTNMWNKVSLEEGEARETQLATTNQFFKPALDKQAQLLRHDNTLESTRIILRYLISNNPLALRIQEELVDERKDLSQTDAGAALNRELLESEAKYQQELCQMKKEMEAAVQGRDEETRAELAEEYNRLENEMKKIQEESKNLASHYNEKTAQLEQKLKDVTETGRRNAELAEARLREAREQAEQAEARRQRERQEAEAQRQQEREEARMREARAEARRQQERAEAEAQRMQEREEARRRVEQAEARRWEQLERELTVTMYQREEAERESERAEARRQQGQAEAQRQMQQAQLQIQQPQQVQRICTCCQCCCCVAKRAGANHWHCGNSTYTYYN